jgi:hypothetical protein
MDRFDLRTQGAVMKPERGDEPVTDRGRRDDSELLETFNRAWDALSEDERQEEREERARWFDAWSQAL